MSKTPQRRKKKAVTKTSGKAATRKSKAATKAPAKRKTKAPKATSKSTSKRKTKAATKTASKATAKRKTKAAKTTSKAPAKRKTKTAAKTASKAPAKRKTKAATKTASKASTKRKTTSKSTSKGKTKTVRKSPAKPRAQKKTSATVKSSKSGHNSATLYKPKKSEEYMSDAQLEHFRTILENWKHDLMEEVDRTINHLRSEAVNAPDPIDSASQETEFQLELRTRDRERKLIRKIDAALQRISEGTYGYCEITGEEIGIARLEARPITTMSVEAQERYEKAERHFGG